MKFNSKLTGALAWAGVVVVLAVPAADWLTTGNEAAAVVVPEVDASRTASVASPQEGPLADTTAGVPAATATAATSTAAADPVDNFISSGRKLPSYISDPPPGAAVAPAAPVVRLVVPDAPAAAATQPAATSAGEAGLEVAVLSEETPTMAPIPYPASMRPPPPARLATAAGARDEGPLIIDSDLVERREAAVARVLGPEPPAGRTVTGSELEEWDSGSLAEYLRRRGLLNEQRGTDVGTYIEDEPDRSRARVIRRLPPSGFFLF